MRFLKGFFSLAMVLVLVFSLVGCGNKSKNTGSTKDGLPKINEIKLGEDYKDLKSTIKVLTHRTDLVDNVFKDYVAKFNEVYPNIKVEYEAVTDYAQDALIRLTADDWGDIMMVPAVDKNELSQYFISFGDFTTLDKLYNFVNNWEFGKQVYGIPSTGNAQGIVYNKKVFEAAGVNELPKTPEDFIAALQKVKDNTDAIPLYTNYAAGWTMGAWDAYLGGSATGDTNYINQVLVHEAAPFSNRGDGTHAYSVYKVLYDATANDLIEEDYTTTDWEGCKGMINNGKIATMVLGSWAIIQMQEAGDNGADIGYMPFPITVNGKQYASAGGDYSYGINAKTSKDNQIASMIYVKWLTEESNFSYDQGGIPIEKGAKYPDTLAAFDGIELVADASALEGEETLLNQINAESELNINAGGNAKVQSIIEHASNSDKSFDDIMAEWNKKWSDTQLSLGIEQK